MSEVRKIKRLDEIGPDLLAAINFPENEIPARAYIFNKNIEDVFENLDKAVKHFTTRVSKMPKCNTDYVIGFIFGKIWENGSKDKDLFLFPFMKSDNGADLSKAHTFMTKNGTMQPWTPYFKEDFGIILADEAIHRRTHTFEEYIKTFPKLRCNEYID